MGHQQFQCARCDRNKECNKKVSLFHATSKNMADFNYDLLLDAGATFSSAKNKKVVTHVTKAKKPMRMVTQT